MSGIAMPGGQRAGELSRIPELDGIRGTAILMVLIYHFFVVISVIPHHSFAGYLTGLGRLGWTGVDLFFVLSGFLIGGILLDHRNAENYFRTFYTRRFFRIVPIYTAILTAIFIIYLATQRFPGAKIAWIFEKRVPWFTYPLFLQNFWMAKLNTLGILGIGATWSLAVEEQFYLTLPWMVRVFNRRSLVAALGVGVLLAPIVRISLRLLWPAKIYTWYVLMPCRADALLLGVLGAILVRDERCMDWLKAKRDAMQYALVVLFLGMGVLSRFAPSMHDFASLSLGYTWQAFFYSLLLVYAVTWQGSWVSGVFRWSWLCWLGSISYGTYLLHGIVQAVFFSYLCGKRPEIASFRDLWVSVAGIVATLVICWLSYKYFESPMQEIGRRAKYGAGKEPVVSKTGTLVAGIS
jgi:peptidoglycan/LPS O-acetylase OafA/YrhL